jgi:hypothetical protein
MENLNWRALAAQADDAVDAAFGVTVQILPWSLPQTGGQPDPYKGGSGQEDEERTARTVRGIYVSPDAAEKMISGMMTKDVVVDMHLSIRSSSVGDAREGDRLSIAGLPAPWPDPFVAELVYTSPGDTGRSLMCLAAVKT